MLGINNNVFQNGCHTKFGNNVLINNKALLFNKQTHKSRSEQILSRISRTNQIIASNNNEPITLEQRTIAGILNLTSVPFSSYIPEPKTFLHKTDAKIKQAGILFLLYIVVASNTHGRMFLSAVVVFLSIITLPPRISKSQLIPLLTMVAFYFAIISMFSDSASIALQSHVPPESIENIPNLILPKNQYSYVIFKKAFINITKKSLDLALSSTSLIIVTLQSASLGLVTTPPEDLAMAFNAFLSPFKPLGVPVSEISFNLLLSLRCLSVVFEEIRNLTLGIAVRGIKWRNIGAMGRIQILADFMNQLFLKLFYTADNMARAMRARGFVGPDSHKLYLMQNKNVSLIYNVIAVLTLVGIYYICYKFF